jgi:hypothetical protein
MDKPITVTLTPLEARAIRSFIQFTEILVESGQLELHDYQAATIKSLLPKLTSNYPKVGV